MSSSNLKYLEFKKEDYLVLILSGLMIIVSGYFFMPQYLELFVIAGVFLAILPLALKTIIEAQIKKLKEEEFLRFAMDLAETLKAGLPISVALAKVAENDYGLLSDSIKRLAARVDWGIGVEESFLLFAEETNSDLIRRNVKMLIELYNSGGNFGRSLEALINSLLEIRRLRREREAAVYENILHAYFIFIFFLGIALVLKVFLIPFLNSSFLPGQEVVKNKNLSNLGETIFYLGLIQAIFAGLILGKMSEGSVKAGVKHSLIFVILTILFLKVIAGIFSIKGNILSFLVGNI